MTADVHDEISEAALRRLFNEFLEMPGLRVTCAQGQRLWGLDEATCRRLLDMLVEANFLCRPAHGTYSRLSDGHTPWPPARMTKARLADGAIHSYQKAV